MTWKAPANNGEKIEGYLVEYKDETSDEWVEAGNPLSTEWVFEGLPTGGDFRFRVAAYNKIGTGPFTEHKDVVSTAGGKTNYILLKSGNYPVIIDPIMLDTKPRLEPAVSAAKQRLSVFEAPSRRTSLQEPTEGKQIHHQSSFLRKTGDFEGHLNSFEVI